MNIKAYLFLFFLCSFSFLSSQEIERKDDKDTLYYYFKHNKKNEHRGPIRPFSKDIKLVVFRVNINDRIHSFNYLTHKRIGEGDRKIPILTKSHSFLKENRDKIQCYKSLKKMDPNELEQLYWNSQFNKVIYLIDKNENTNGEIFLRKVRWNSAYLLKQ